MTALQERFFKAYDEECVGRRTCVLELDKVLGPNGQQDPQSASCRTLRPQESAYVLKLDCVQPDVHIPLLELDVPMDLLAVCCVASDLLITLLLYLSLICLRNFQKMSTNDVQEHLLTADDFAVCFKQLPPKSGKHLNELKANIWIWAENILRREGVQTMLNPETATPDKNQNELMNVYFGVSKYWKLNKLLSISKNMKKRMKLRKKTKLFKQDHGAEIEALNAESEKKVEELRVGEEQHYPDPVVAFLQFRSMNGVQKFTNALNYSKCWRAWLMLTCRGGALKHKYLHGTIWPDVQPAPEPTLICWQNLGIGTINRFVRRTILNLIFLVILIAGFLGISFGHQYSLSRESTQDPCAHAGSPTTLTAEQAVADAYDGLSDHSLRDCYCFREYLKAEGLMEVLGISLPGRSSENLCLDWMLHFAVNKFSLVSVAALIVGINMSELLLFQWISQFERSHFITNQLRSSLTKMFLVQYFNMALITILMYANVDEVGLPPDFPIFNGKYKKFDIEWYEVVGSTIFVTMILQIFAPNISYLFKPVARFMIQCWDRRCRLNERVTSQILQEDYEAKYIGIEFEIDKRYSQIVAQVFIIMTFSSGIPLLYPVGLVCQGVSYWCDKYLVLRLYRTPPQYDDAMAARVRNLIKMSIICHCLMSMYIYSNDQILHYQNRNSVVASVRTFTERAIENLGGSAAFEQLDAQRHGWREYMYFYSSHSLLYFYGLIFILILVLLEEVFGGISMFGKFFSFVTRMDQHELEQMEQMSQAQMAEVRRQAFTAKQQSREFGQNQVLPINMPESTNFEVIDYQKGHNLTQEASVSNNDIGQASQSIIPVQESVGDGALNENHPEEKEQAPDVSPIPVADHQGEEAAVSQLEGGEENDKQDVPLVQPAEVEDIPEQFLNSQAEQQTAVDRSHQVAERSKRAKKSLKTKKGSKDTLGFNQFRQIKKVLGESFSVDFYKEINVVSLQKEYNKTILELIDYRVGRKVPSIFLNPIEKDYRLHYRSRLVDKLKAIKSQLRKYIKERKLRPQLAPASKLDWIQNPEIDDVDRTQEDFEIVVSALKTEGSYYRLQSVYCYDILEQYDQVKQVMMKIRRFQGQKSMVT